MMYGIRVATIADSARAGQAQAEARARSAESELVAAYRRWREAVADVEAAETDSGIPVEPVYAPTDDDGISKPADARRYIDALAFPGQPPFTRGIYPTMYRGRPWTIRLYSGWGTAEDTNERFRYLLDRGQTGCRRQHRIHPPLVQGTEPPRSVVDLSLAGSPVVVGGIAAEAVDHFH